MASPKIVLANGCFDPFHYGHLLHLQAARSMGDRLVVSVTKNVHVNKGPDRPVFDEQERAAVLRELRCVDEVILSINALDALRKVKPDIFVKGDEYDGLIQARDMAYCLMHGIKIAYTHERRYSSTALLRHYAASRRNDSKEG